MPNAQVGRDARQPAPTATKTAAAGGTETEAEAPPSSAARVAGGREGPAARKPAMPWPTRRRPLAEGGQQPRHHDKGIDWHPMSCTANNVVGPLLVRPDGLCTAAAPSAARAGLGPRRLPIYLNASASELVVGETVFRGGGLIVERVVLAVAVRIETISIAPRGPHRGRDAGRRGVSTRGRRPYTRRRGGGEGPAEDPNGLAKLRV